MQTWLMFLLFAADREPDRRPPRGSGRSSQLTCSGGRTSTGLLLVQNAIFRGDSRPGRRTLNPGGGFRRLSHHLCVDLASWKSPRPPPHPITKGGCAKYHKGLTGVQRRSLSARRRVRQPGITGGGLRTRYVALLGPQSDKPLRKLLRCEPSHEALTESRDRFYSEHLPLG